MKVAASPRIYEAMPEGGISHQSPQSLLIVA